MARLSVGLHSELNAKQMVDCGKLAEALGLEAVWLGESNRRECVSILGSLSKETAKIVIGSNIINVYSRSPTLIAMAAATLDELSRGRFILGLGSSTPIFVGAHGQSFKRPLQRVRIYVEIIRRLIAGEATQLDSPDFKMSRFKLGFQPPRNKIPIYLAALGLKMAELAGEVADGILLNMATTSHVKRMCAAVRRGAQRAGRSPGDIEVGCALPASSDPLALKKIVAFYSSAAFYDTMLTTSGFGKEVGAIKDQWQKGDMEGAMGAVTDGMLNSVTLGSTREAFVQRLDAYREAGVGLPIILPLVKGPNAVKEFGETLKDALS